MDISKAIETFAPFVPIILAVLGYIAGSVRRESKADDRTLESKIKNNKEGIGKMGARVGKLENGQIQTAEWRGNVNRNLENINCNIKKMMNGKR